MRSKSGPGLPHGSASVTVAGAPRSAGAPGTGGRRALLACEAESDGGAPVLYGARDERPGWHRCATLTTRGRTREDVSAEGRGSRLYGGGPPSRLCD